MVLTIEDLGKMVEWPWFSRRIDFKFIGFLNNSHIKMIDGIKWVLIQNLEDHSIYEVLESDLNETKKPIEELNIDLQITFSMDHITESDYDELSILVAFESNAFDCIVHDNEHKFIITIKDKSKIQLMQQKNSEYDFSKHFWKLIKIANDNKCNIVIIDPEETAIKTLKTFDWQ